MTSRPNTMIDSQAKQIQQTSARIMKTDKSSKFWDRLAHRYAKKPVPDQDAYQKKLDVTRGYLKPDFEVLEIGCGTGTTALKQTQYVKHIYATDFSATMIEIAKEKATRQKVDNVTFEQKSIDDLELADDSYDVVMGHSILHLLDNTDEVIARVHKALKPNGVFVTSTVCLGDKMSYFKYVAPLGRWLGVLPVLNVFTADELESAFIQAGYEIDYQWRQDDGRNVFIVARKSA